MNTGLIEALHQLRNCTWDGDLISKDYRTQLVKLGYAKRCNGWNFITRKGVKALTDFGLLRY